MRSPNKHFINSLIMAAIVCAGLAVEIKGQRGNSSELDDPERSNVSQGKRGVGGVRPVTIPITVRSRKDDAVQSELQPLGTLTVREDGEEQKILSIRAIGTDTPISVAVLVQDDVVASISNEIKSMKEFIRRLPRGSRVMVGYIRSGSLEIRQRFTADLDRAADALRTPIGSASAAPYNPYIEILEGLRRFESMPRGRRAMLVVSDGLDISRGLDSAQPSQSIDLRRAVKEAQRQAVAIYSFYAPSVTSTSLNNFSLIGYGQGSLQLLSEDTGGRAFFQGTGAPVSFDPFLRDLAGTFIRQIALTYLSTHPKKGFHRIEVTSDRRDIEIDHPAGYTR
jgi:VWFA-related protein